mmetsp:Transcript_158983/g.486536  ORF Transcript_158983/g.486536 Transcript_158983/m.486536 type:complete len:492 (-) Transcript_158983:792-2267(-)
MAPDSKPQPRPVPASSPGPSAAGERAPREYVRFEVVDFHGKALSKTVPGRHLQDKVCIYSGALAYGANAEVITFPSEVSAAGCPNSVLLPDWTTVQQLPWACRPERDIVVKRVYCELASLDSEATRNEAVPRTLCKRLLQELRAFGHQGLELMAGGELEFVLAKPAAGEGGWEPLFSGTDIFATLQNSKAMDFCYEVERCMEPVGIDVLTINAEYGAGQVEITFAPKLGLEAADMLATFRTGVKEMAQQQGLRASFMGKPFGAEGPGSGGHFNFSLWAGGGGRSEPLERVDAVLSASGGRTNVFHSTADAEGLSPTARSFLAGVLLHAPAMEALCSPTPSCYCRHGRWAPAVANWGLDDRYAYVRVKASSRGRPTACYMELRAPSAAANPYLVAAATVAAGLDGLERGLQLPPARQGREDGATPLPESLGEALGALEGDAWMVEKLGPVFVRWYAQVKREELKAIEARLATTGQSEEDRSAVWRHFYMEYV